MLNLYDSLAVQIKCPPDLKHILEVIIPQDKVSLLLAFSTWNEIDKVAGDLGLAAADVEKEVKELFKGGLVLRKGKSAKTRSFYGIVNTLLGEGKLDNLSALDLKRLREFYLSSRLKIYDRYLEQGRIETSSRVLTTREALEHHNRLHSSGSSRIVPTDEAYNILNRAHKIALVPCSCRLTFRNCEKPKMTCINLNTSAEELIARGVGVQICRDRAKSPFAVYHL